MDNSHWIYVRIDGEPFLSRAQAYREAKRAHADAWWEFARSRGATGVPYSLSGLNFDRGPVPDGWTVPDRKHGFSRPKKGHPDIEIMARLPKKPDARAVFGDMLLEEISYETDGGEGFESIGWSFEGPRIGWVGDVIIATIPHARRAAEAHIARHPDHRITNGADQWDLPSGLTEISEAEKNLLVAQYEVERERSKSREVA